MCTHLKHHTAHLRYTQLYILTHTVYHTSATMGEEKVLVAWMRGRGGEGRSRTAGWLRTQQTQGSRAETAVQVITPQWAWLAWDTRCRRTINGLLCKKHEETFQEGHRSFAGDVLSLRATEDASVNRSEPAGTLGCTQAWGRSCTIMRAPQHPRKKFTEHWKVGWV